ncbi:MAG: hypothetical protein ABI833_24040 [Acidobacteriota bacterium]
MSIGERIFTIELTPEQKYLITNASGISIPAIQIKWAHLAALAMVAQAAGIDALPYSTLAIDKMLGRSALDPRTSGPLITLPLTESQQRQVAAIIGRRISKFVFYADDLEVSFTEQWERCVEPMQSKSSFTCFSPASFSYSIGRPTRTGPIS